jgi:hypothetical protein
MKGENGKLILIKTEAGLAVRATTQSIRPLRFDVTACFASGW